MHRSVSATGLCLNEWHGLLCQTLFSTFSRGRGGRGGAGQALGDEEEVQKLWKGLVQDIPPIRAHISPIWVLVTVQLVRQSLL